MFADGLHTPDYNFIFWLGIVTSEEPEEKLPLLILVVCDGQKASVAFADVPRDIGKSTSVDSECLLLSGQYREAILQETHVR
jgi:hypothetical protein